MKIAASDISMASSHQLETYTNEKKTVKEVQAAEGAKVIEGVAAIFEASDATVVSAMEQYSRQEARTEERQSKAQEWANASKMLEQMRQAPPEMPCIRDIFEDMRSKLLDKMLALLNGLKDSDSLHLGELTHGHVLDLRSSSTRVAGFRFQMFSGSTITATAIGPGASVGTTSGGTLWQRVTAASTEHAEYERTTFQSQGFALTEDGRNINFDVEFSMARSFTQKFDALTSESFLLTDPLIINLDSDVTSVSDVKFKFDLDSDGQEEEISFAGEGSGFLALDRNGNGRIDDGNELFGTKSGNGFADLAEYDEDGNLWIDENDSVYSKLKVWTRDAGGNEKLMGLKEANVGAIYLGNVSTEFSLNDAITNETDAVVRKTGVFLKETGEVGTLNHVDLRS